MTDIEKYEAVNKTKTLEQLADVVESFTDYLGLIAGKSKVLNGNMMVNNIRTISKPGILMNSYLWRGLTRKYGIRQQVMMLRYYENLGI